jgi:AcrR family transcriptional regulator
MTADKKRERMAPDDRKGTILRAAVELAAKLGYMNVTRDAIATNAGVSTGLVTRYFNSMPEMRLAIVRAAIDAECVEVVAQAFAAGEKIARECPVALRKKVVKHINVV